MFSLNNIFKRVKKTLELSLVLARAEFKLRNEGSYLGILWYLLNPIFTFAILFLVFYDRLGKDIMFYPIYLMVGVIMFNSFQNVTIESTKSIIQEHRWLIKSINFPQESLIIAIVLKNIFSHFFEFLLLACLMIYMKVSLIGLVFYLLVFLFFEIFVLGISLILSSLTVYFVDIENVWNFAARILWLATPIFYAIEGQNRLLALNYLNPMYYFITFARSGVITTRLPEPLIIGGTFLFSMLFLAIGIIFFRIFKNKFAEKV